MIGEFATNSVIGGEFADHFTLWKAAFRYPLSGFYDNISKKKRIVFLFAEFIFTNDQTLLHDNFVGFAVELKKTRN